VEMETPFEIHKLILVFAMMLSYTTVLKSMFSLMHCVEVEGSLVLWYQGEVGCYQPWQYVIISILILLTAFPPGLIVWIRWKKLRGLHVGSAAYIAFCSPFVDGREFWMGVQFIERFIIVAVFSLTPNPLDRAGLMLAICVTALIALTILQPHRSMVVASIDVVLHGTMVVAAGLNGGLLTLVATGYNPKEQDALHNTAWAVFALFVVPIILAVGLHLTGMKKSLFFWHWRNHRCRSGHDHAEPRSLELQVETNTHHRQEKPVLLEVLPDTPCDDEVVLGDKSTTVWC